MIKNIIKVLGVLNATTLIIKVLEVLQKSKHSWWNSSICTENRINTTLEQSGLLVRGIIKVLHSIKDLQEVCPCFLSGVWPPGPRQTPSAGQSCRWWRRTGCTYGSAERCPCSPVYQRSNHVQVNNHLRPNNFFFSFLGNFWINTKLTGKCKKINLFFVRPLMN